MTTNEAALKLARPIIGIHVRTAQEVFDIMADRIKSHFAAEAEEASGINQEVSGTVPGLARDLRRAYVTSNGNWQAVADVALKGTTHGN